MKFKRTGHKVALAVAVAALAAGQPVSASGTTVEDLSARLESMAAEMAALRMEVNQLRQEKAAAEKATGIADIREEVQYLREDVDEIDDRLMEPERHAALDGIQFGGDFRFEAHSISADMPNYIDGMKMQGMMVGGLQQFGMLGETFTFDELKSVVQGLPPGMVENMMQQLAPMAYTEGYKFKDDLVRTSRLRLDMKARVGENVSFTGRLAMYKVWGDSTGVQVFNGQPTSINWDGTQATYPNSDDVIHVDRAYFTWSQVAGTNGFLSIGRRPSTEGVPVNFRQDEPRGGTPMGSLFNYQFDGITLGYHFNDYSALRLCYGVGYESAWGNASQLKRPSDVLEDTTFYGLVWDAWNTPSMYVHLIAAQALDISDGFPGMTILPVNPLTGEAIPAAIPTRYEPTGTIGDMTLLGAVVTRRDGPFDYFLSYGHVETDPTDFTSPFGGMLSDPFDLPKSRNGNMIYVGARYNFDGERTKIGVEYNHGSKHWFNFALSEDDFIAPKTNTRGDVWEAYMTHRIRDRFIFKLAYIDYDYDYSGSGWLLGAPKDLSSVPMLGFPTYQSASMWTLGLTARF